MQSPKRPGRPARSRRQSPVEAVPEGVEPDDEFGADIDDLYEMYRVTCPDCARSIALLADEEVLPEHALCSSPWNPFGLQVCPGTGRPADEATIDDVTAAQEQDSVVLLALPQGLDWRTQPFSHVGGPGSRPLPMPQMRRPAA